MYHKKTSKHTLSATGEKKRLKPQNPNQNQNKLNSIEINKDPDICRFNSHKTYDTKNPKKDNVTELNTKKDKKIVSINLSETNKTHNQHFSRPQKIQKISDVRPTSSKRIFNTPLSPNTASKSNKNNNEINWEKSKSNNNMKTGNKNTYILNNRSNNYTNININDSIKQINFSKLLNEQSIQELDSEENDEKKNEKNNKNINVIINVNSPNKKTPKNLNINENNNKINRDLLLYSQKGDKEKVLEILSQENTNINYQNENGWSALHYACDEGNLKIVEILIKAHINVNIKNNDKKTSLHISVFRGYFDISKLLVENGADLNVRDNEQNLPIHICSANGYNELLNYLLQKNSSFVTSKNLFGNTPLDLAKNKETKSIIEKFIRNNKSKNSNIKEVNIVNNRNSLSSSNNYLNFNEQTSKIKIHKANQKQIKALIMPIHKNNNLKNNEIDYSNYYGNNDNNNNAGSIAKKNNNNNLVNHKKISSSSCKKKIIFNINITNNSASNFPGKENNLYYNTSSQIRKNNTTKNQFLIEVNQTYNSPLYLKKSKDYFFSNKNVNTSAIKNKNIADKKDNKISKIIKNLYDKEISGVTLKNKHNSNNNTNTNTTKNMNMNANLNINISGNNTYTCINNQNLKKNRTKGLYVSDNLMQNCSPKKIMQKINNNTKNQRNINGGKILRNNLNNSSNNNTNNQYFTSHRTISLPGFMGKTNYCTNLNNSNKKDLYSNVNESNTKQSKNNNENKYSKKNFQTNKGKSLYKKITKNNNNSNFEYTSKKVYRPNNTIEKFNKNMSACVFENNKSKMNKNINRENYTITINKTNKNQIKNICNHNNESTQKEIKISKIYTDEDGENNILIDDLDEEEEIKLNKKDQKNNYIKNLCGDIEYSENDVNIFNNNNNTDEIEDSLSNYESEDNTSNKEEKIGPSNFICLALLGQGSFGEVYLVKKKDSNDYYAMKVLDKKRIEIQNIFKYAMTERNVLSIINFPFIVKLNYAFQTKEKLFLLLDYCPGGDLSKQLQIQTRFSEDMAKFYICEIALALGELHKKDIIFRDLKPDNIVIDKEGHAMLTDFGLSREGVNEKHIAKSFCGSIAYLAPEMLSRSGHGKAVDWYLLGVCFYEMLVGMPPYFSNNQEQIFKNIEKADLYIPSFVSKSAQILIRDLLKKDPKERLGSKNDVEDIKKHPYFNGIDWNMVYLRKYIPPPIIQKSHYLRFFDHPKIFVDDYDENNDLFEKNGMNSSQGNIYEGWSFVQCPNNDKENGENKNKNKNVRQGNK